MLDVLAAKQRVLNDLQRVERALDPFRDQDPESRVWRNAEARADCARLLDECERLLQETVEQERQSEAALTVRRDEAACQVARRSRRRTCPRRLLQPKPDINQPTRSLFRKLVVSQNVQQTKELSSTASCDALLPGEDADLQTVLAAWHSATLRLEHTHVTLQEEVRRLTDELEEKNRELARKNRLADLGQMAAHVAHEVRNNLVPVSLYLSLLRRNLREDEQNLEVLDKVEAGFRALDVTVNDLLHFTSDRDPQCQKFSLDELLREICDSLRPQLSAQTIAVSIQIDSELMANADREMIRRALLNLVLNAVDAHARWWSARVGSHC